MNSTRTAVALGAVGLVLSSVALVWFLADSPEPTEAERLEERLDRTAVHVHLALRSRLDGSDGSGGSRTASALVAAASSSAEADRLAEALFADRATGRAWLRSARQPTARLSALRVPNATVPPGTDHAAFFLALLAETAVDDRRIPKQVLVYEATRLSVGAIEDPVVAGLARAGRALVFASSGYCTMAEAEASAAREAAPSRGEFEASAEQWLSEPLEELVVLHDDMRRAVTVLAGSAEACCAIRRNDPDAAAESIARCIEDAEALGVSAGRVSLLRGWVALFRGDEAEARAQLARVQQGDPDDVEGRRLSMLRDALATESEEAFRAASEPLLDRRWLSQLALRGVWHAFDNDGLLRALDQRPEGAAMRELAAGHAEVIAAARAREPMFDQAHQGDQGVLERVSQLF